MSFPNNIVIIDTLGPRRQTVRERLDALTGRMMDHRTWAEVDRILELAVATGEYNEPDIYGAFKRLEEARLSCEMAEWHRAMARAYVGRIVIR